MENALKNGNLHGLEYEVLCRWFDYMTSSQAMPIDLIGVYIHGEVSFQCDVG